MRVDRGQDRWVAGWLLLAAPALAGADRPPKPPRDAPYCAVPGTHPLFVSPMGEPFRAAPGQAYPSSAWFAGADRNHDGKVDRAEFAVDGRRFFRTLDRDGDGRLTPEEIGVYERDVAPEIALYSARREPDEGRRHGGEGGNGIAAQLGFGGSGADDYGGPLGAGRYAWLNIPEPVAAADLDVDRVVTEAEFVAAASRRFDALDVRGEGALRLASLPRTPAQIAIEGPCRARPKPKRADGRRGAAGDEDERESPR